MKKHPRTPMVGIGTFIVRNGKILLGKRKGSHGAGEWSLPGGHLEWFEKQVPCMFRENKEETKITRRHFSKPVKLGWTENFFPVDHKHYITLYFLVVLKTDVEPVNAEPNKCEGWHWFSPEKLPRGMFAGTRRIMKEIGITTDKLMQYERDARADNPSR